MLFVTKFRQTFGKLSFVEISTKMTFMKDPVLTISTI